MTGIFEDTEGAAELQCESDDSSCELLDKTFPLEAGLVQSLIDLTVKILSGSIYKPKDSENNASDDLSELASFLR
jgi:hypothetical protein